MGSLIPFPFRRHRKLGVWHGLFFISLHESEHLTQEQAALRIRMIAGCVSLQFPEIELDLDDDSLNHWQPEE